MNDEKIIEVLNDLVEINNDRIEGYLTAVNETREDDLRALFNKFITTSQKCHLELASEITRLGGIPTESTKTSGKFFRVWMDFKSTLTNHDRKAILNSCEFGEDAAVETYHNTIKDNVELISTDQQVMLISQLALIQADHDKIKVLCDELVEH